jgi:hypothetical protein
MMTDPRRARRRDPGDPNDCPAYTLHRIYCTPEELEYTAHGCRTAEIGCLDCKHIMIARAETELGPIRERRHALAARPDQFVQTLTVKLMTYGIGRGIEFHDMPTVRSIVRESARDDYRFVSLITNIVKSAPFRMKQLPADAAAPVATKQAALTR